MTPETKQYFEAPEERKARELYNKFYELAYVPWNGGSEECMQEEATKEICLIAVDEILNTPLPMYDVAAKDFWKKVKEEINKL